jgi:hypothetical protein
MPSTHSGPSGKRHIAWPTLFLNKMASSAGRRVCVGMHLGDRELFIAFARLVYAFKLEAGLQEDGTPCIIDSTKMKVQFNVAPSDYQLRLTPRWDEEQMSQILNVV